MIDLLIKIFLKKYDNVEAGKKRTICGVFCGIVGIVCNFTFFLAKLLIGISCSSITIIADSVNNISDVASFIITIIGFKIISKPADKKHPFGYGRAEYVCTIIVAILIAMTGIELLKTSAYKILTPEDSYIDKTGILILFLSILIKLWLSFFFRKMGKKISSSVLIANSRDSLTDMIATFTVLLSAFIAQFTKTPVDGIFGIIISSFVIYSGIKTFREVLGPILGQAPSEEFTELVKKQVLSYEEVKNISDIVVHNYGWTRSIVSLRAELGNKLSLNEVEVLIARIEKEMSMSFSCEFLVRAKTKESTIYLKQQ
ncbi:MAG: cation diffusion facilitator family transporter [Oscillospiraceae bacterium]|jgi:cation diffusion facilitator family transporter|nr:cation diffusion facilitator family transporter [Oscillospiraceae bacterium]